MNRVLGCRSNKSSDPFVVLTLEDEMRTDTPDQRKTEVRPNTLNPQFDQTFAFKMRPESHDIRLRVDVFYALHASSRSALDALGLEAIRASRFTRAALVEA